MENYYAWGAQELNQLHQRRQPEIQEVHLVQGMLLEDVHSGWVGIAKTYERIGAEGMVGLEDYRGKIKTFPLGFGFLLEGTPVKVLPPRAKNTRSVPKISRSGSIAVENAPAQVARASRIWVEGIHDAELVEKVWGHDLRVEGIVVEPLHGIDDLPDAVREFCPAPHRRLGVLVDHLVEGSKESHIVAQTLQIPGARNNVQIVGHPFVDIWQAVRPQRLGIKKWPVIPREEEWKKGVLKRLGLPCASQEDVAQAWKKILGRVNSYQDLEPTLLAPVEQLIDFLMESPE
ncbi:DUF3097 family protein [Rothia sp. P7181]|uniref:DUF3097 family protein n=1 Tax=unclassified Rothia (in: high G+C Gram-positive bacteria) TaxID=2689056 RepID=UPI003AE56424